jgi:G3E family GTPase
VIVLNKTDLADAEQLRLARAVVRGLNPDARLIEAAHGRVPLHEILDTGRYDVERSRRLPGWAKELAGDHTPETEEYGIASFVWRARRPLHPQRFARSLNRLPGMIRAKGWFWLASRMA